ncbi:hypothetical protein SAMN05421823_10981 [Catalinimonas alkaloidigena]|uniref:Uncharacterized protein n=1 Tax=Catalinimonas alkaloidigena TaxID=1075417 RepID=A0A1G9P5F6_9BACT|nr:hypothetical protein [Catalinimonas alkaloidigena]SDL93731.1 hypothetical protein SAMN05421823_10981 [Catalinimonas alkaloidigena]
MITLPQNPTLLDSVIAAYGGIDTWNKYQTLQAHVRIGGVTWGLKGHENALQDVVFTGALHEQNSSWTHVFEPNTRSVFEPGRVALLNERGDVLEELRNPRDSFKGHTLATPWTKLQLVYFSSYATWNYLTAPFHLLQPGFQLTELDPWEENGETFRRLEARYPDTFATHSRRQVYYFDAQGLIRRHDYWPEVLGGSSATQIIEDYQTFAGIKTGTKRRIYILNDADNHYQPEPVLVSIDVLDLRFHN